MSRNMTYEAIRRGAVYSVVVLACLSATAEPFRCAGPEALRQVAAGQWKDQELARFTRAEADAFVNDLLHQAFMAPPDEATREAWYGALRAFLGHLRFYGKGFMWEYPWAQAQYGKILWLLTGDWKTTTAAMQAQMLAALADCDVGTFRRFPNAQEVTGHVADLLSGDNASLRKAAAEALCHLWRSYAPPDRPPFFWEYPYGSDERPPPWRDVVARHPDWCRQLDRIDIETDGSPSAIWLLALGPASEAFDLLEAKYRACDFGERLCCLMSALRFADKARYAALVSATGSRLCDELAQSPAFPSEWWYETPQRFVLDELAFNVRDVVLDPSMSAWCKEQIYAPETRWEFRKFLVEWLIDRSSPWGIDLLAQAYRDGLHLEGLPQSALLAAFVRSEGSDGVAPAVAYLDARLKESPTLHLDQFERSLLFSIGEKGDATDIPILIAMARSADQETGWTLGDAVSTIFARCGTADQLDAFVDVAIASPERSPQRRALAETLRNIERWPPSMDVAGLIRALRRCLDSLDAEMAFPAILQLGQVRHANLKRTDAAAGRADREAADELMSMFTSAEFPPLRATIAGTLATTGDPRVPGFAADALKYESEPIVRRALEECVAMYVEPPGLEPWRKAVVAALLLLLVAVLFRKRLRTAARAMMPTSPRLR